MSDTVPQLIGWENFYVIVGSSGAALTGLQFVVIALVKDLRAPTSPETIGAFGTPTIVHFSAVLFVASMLSVPWQGLLAPAVLLAIAGATGIAYIVLITRRARQQVAYTPVLEDWIWHSALPFIAYLLLFIGATMLRTYTSFGLFAMAATSLLLLFIGIHNAWDTVTYIVVDQRSQPPG